MKKVSFAVVVFGFFLTSLTACSPGVPYIGNGYGVPISYGEGKHPGIDYDVLRGTPIIACSDGIVNWIGSSVVKTNSGGGHFVTVRHKDDFYSVYGHLSDVFVSTKQEIKRGQLIGLSGGNGYGYDHLHFAISNVYNMGALYSRSLDPNRYWLNSKQQCFDPKQDYSKFSEKEITLPVACSGHRKTLKKNIKKLKKNIKN